MSSATLWIWDKDNEEWVKLAGTPAGAMSIHALVEALSDIEDVDVAGIADGMCLYWDNAASLWVVKQFLPLAGGTLTGPLIIDDDTYIQIGDTVGSPRILLPEVGDAFSWYQMQPGAGNRSMHLMLQPKGTSERTQMILSNRDVGLGSDYSCFNVEVNAGLCVIQVEDVGTPPTSITVQEFRNDWGTQKFYPTVDRTYDLGESDKRYSYIYAHRHNITQDLGGDHNWSGTTATMTAGIALVLPQAVYVGGDGKMEKALATAAATMPAIALACGTIAENAEGEFLMQGFFRDNTWDWTPGGLLYVSRATAGALTQVLPAIAGEQVQVVGVAITADIIHFNPSYELVEIS